MLEVRNGDIDRLIHFIEGLNFSSHIPLISTWAEENRHLPRGVTKSPGLINHGTAPHLVEIQDCMHPDSGIEQVSVQKSTQSLVTTTFENVIGHAIKYKLHNILYIISSKAMAGIRSSAAIDVLIDHSDLAQYMRPMSTRMKKKVADNKFYKEMHGNRRIMLTSWNSIADAKSLDWDLIIMDELDEAPYELAGQGDPESIFAGRGKTFKGRGLKIVKLGTPTTVSGRIHRNFLEGDQRYHYCQCQRCGEGQVLMLKGMGRDYGLTARSETIDNVENIIPETVKYICKYCKESMQEFEKGKMLGGGVWVPTARPINPLYRSYHVSNLMSPVAFYPWSQVMQEFSETRYGADVTKFKNFKIDVLGEPWEHRSTKKDWTFIRDRAEDYELKTVPNGGLAVTSGVDIQATWIELVSVAWGRQMESWIVDHVKFRGDTKHLKNQVWNDLRNYLITTRYKLQDINLPIYRTAIDSGYNPKAFDRTISNDVSIEHIVYDFVAGTPRTIACRGNGLLSDIILKEHVVKKSKNLKIRYDLAVTELKDDLDIKINYEVGTPGGVHFSNRLHETFFMGFLSESWVEHKPGEFGWKKHYDRNEPLDCYNLARGAAERINLPTYTIPVWDEYERKLFS